MLAEDDMGLYRESDMNEVRRVVFSIYSDSAPSPDRFCSRFYHVSLKELYIL